MAFVSGLGGLGYLHRGNDVVGRSRCERNTLVMSATTEPIRRRDVLLAVMSVAAPWVAFAVNGGNVGAAEDGALKSLKFVKTSSGLRYADVVTGSGSSPQEGDIVVVDYVGYLSNGQVFDNSKSPGRKPLAFPLGQRKVIPAWEEALSTMKSGGTRKIIVPPSLAYGDRGVCVPSGECLIPPNETLEYDLKLLRIAPPPI